MAISVSFATKTAVMLTILAAVYFTITAEVDLAQKQKHFNYMKEIALYTESKLMHGLNSVNAYDSNSTQALLLPQLDFPYSVSMSCDENLVINVSSETGRYYDLIEFFNCSKISASGTVYPGNRCITVKKESETTASVELGESCELV